ncbi:MAG: cobalamin-binding protein [Nitrospirota bacterium]|nr:cobalamin-binding protein [Nitrospirota bacterium]
MNVLTKKFAVIFFFITIHYSLLTVSTVSYADSPKRIISLAPNITEILFALGVDDRVIGVSSFCDYPEAAKQKTKVGGLSNPSLEAVNSLRPDMVFLTHDGNPKAFEERLRSMKIHTVVIQARKISDLPSGIRQIGAAVGSIEKAELLAVEIEKRISNYTVREETLRTQAKPQKKQRVLFIIWPDPLIVAGPGTTTNEALSLLGLDNIASGTSIAYPKYSIEEILRQAPDLIFIGKGNGMDKVADGLLRRLKTVPAIRDGRVYYVSDYLYRLGPRTMNGVDELAAHLKKP